jgi:hypothetical protein
MTRLNLSNVMRITTSCAKLTQSRGTFVHFPYTLSVKLGIICSIPTGFQIRPLDNSKTQSKNVFMVTICKARNIDQKITIGEKEYMIPSEKVNP